MARKQTQRMSVRAADPADAASIAAIYAPFVTDTIVSFEITPPTAAEMGRRLAAGINAFPWLVCTAGASICGFAFAGRHRSREAYQWCAEVSVYVDVRWQRRRVGRALYAALFAVLQAQGYRNLYAGIALPNDGSEAFHRSCGFEPIGVYRQIGYKRGAWRDVAWYGLRLGSDDGEPTPPAAFSELHSDASLTTLLAIGDRELSRR